MLKKLIPAIAVTAMLLAPSVASAAVGGVGAGPRINVGSIGSSRDDRAAAYARASSRRFNC